MFEGRFRTSKKARFEAPFGARKGVAFAGLDVGVPKPFRRLHAGAVMSGLAYRIGRGAPGYDEAEVLD